MITKYKTGFCGKDSDYDFIGESIMINQRQRQKLYELINYNIQNPDEKENRIRELSDLTSIEAEDMIFQYLSATWS